MSFDKHYRNLEKMYLAAPINKLFAPSIDVKDKEAIISIKVNEEMFHSAKGLHGSVYFKMLDDAAFFAVNSLESEFAVLTASFTIKLTRPVLNGTLKSIGKVVKENRNKWIAEAILYNDGKEVSFGSGTFVKGKQKLVEALGYY